MRNRSFKGLVILGVLLTAIATIWLALSTLVTLFILSAIGLSESTSSYVGNGHWVSNAPGFWHPHVAIGYWIISVCAGLFAGSLATFLAAGAFYTSIKKPKAVATA